MTTAFIARLPRHKIANDGIQACPICNRIYPCNHINCACGAPLREVIKTSYTPEYYPAGN